MFDYSEGFKTLQIELSTVCNALCPGCTRTDSRNYNRTKPYIPKAKFLDESLIVNLVQDPKAKSLLKLEFCGNIDEPLAHPRFLELLERVQQVRPDLGIILHTNGGLRDPSYFRELVAIMKGFKKECHIRFSIDGLEDTNHLYRQNVRFEKAYANLKASCEAGANVIWQVLAFPWNKHQIEEIKTLAEKTGCREVWVRPDRSEASARGLEQIQKLKLQNTEIDERPRGHLGAVRQSLRAADTQIDCYFKRNGMLFLSWEGKVWPCCFISNVFYEGQLKVEYFKRKVLERYEENFNSLYHHSFSEVLSHPYFQRELMESWDTKSRSNRLNWRCWEKCNTGRRRSSDGQMDDRTHLEHLELNT